MSNRLPGDAGAAGLERAKSGFQGSGRPYILLGYGSCLRLQWLETLLPAGRARESFSKGGARRQAKILEGEQGRNAFQCQNNRVLSTQKHENKTKRKACVWGKWFPVKASGWQGDRKKALS